MKYYRHYKNKPYKYVGIAKHSETLEDMVIYETRYENKLGKIWVRPKEMFFENVEINGKLQPRFEKIPIRIDSTTHIGEKEFQLIRPLMVQFFDQWEDEYFFSGLRSRTQHFLNLAYVDEKVVGAKLGYALDKSVFYSWMGGVLPEFRGMGIASDLLVHQHNWCKENGFAKIQTKTQNKYREMLLLNIFHGFEICGTQSSDHGLLIILEKRIKP
jgi:GNAT superfamily N-acetyltransferase